VNIQSTIRTYHSELILLGILILASVFLLFNLAKEGYSNSYYAAAVKSMLTNPAIMIYNSYDPTGFVTVDKPPVSLWVQTLSAALLGFSGSAVILPQALAGICCVLLLDLLISGSWGKYAGLIAAFALTITPIFVAVARTNNMDGLLIFVLLCAVCLAFHAWKTRSPVYLIGAAVLIGIGFNIKMIQAFAVVPACFGIYLLNVRIPWKKKILHLVVASAVLLLVSASWAMMMDLTPADQRPYIGSSTGNSEFNLIFGYNGLNRLLGGLMSFHGGEMSRNLSDRRGYPGVVPVGSGGSFPPGMNKGFPSPGPDWNSTPGDQGSFPDRARESIQDPYRASAGSSGLIGNGTAGMHPVGMGSGGRVGEGPGGMPGMNDGGEPGLFRMGDAGMSGQISWLLPFALIGLLAWITRPSLPVLKNLNEKAVLTIALAFWLFPELIYFSFTSGFYHTYYVVMVAIPLAGLVGIGAASMYDAYRKPGVKGWLLVAAVLVTGVCQWIFLGYTPEFLGPLSWIVLMGSLLGAVALVLLRFRSSPDSTCVTSTVILIILGLLCVAPFVWSCTPVFYKEQGGMPSAGPGLASGPGHSPGMMPGENQENSSALYSYLSSHQSGEKYILGVESSRSAGDLILSYGAPVMAMGGYSGRDNILTNESLKTLIQNGEIRYFLLGQAGHGMPGRESNGVTTWIQDSCPVVSDTQWSGTGSSGVASNATSPVRSMLYDCKNVV